MQVKGEATLVGFKRGSRKSDGSIWERVTLLNDGETIKVFLSETASAQLNGERDRVVNGELIPVTFVLSLREKGYDVAAECIALSERKPAGASK